MRRSLEATFPDLRPQPNPYNYLAKYKGDSLVIWYGGYEYSTYLNVNRKVSFKPDGRDTAFWLRQPAVVAKLLNLRQLNFLTRDIKEYNYKIVRDVADSNTIYAFFPFGDEDDQLIINYRAWDRTLVYKIMKPWQLMYPGNLKR